MAEISIESYEKNPNRSDIRKRWRRIAFCANNREQIINKKHSIK
jgi:hypothetical protein